MSNKRNKIILFTSVVLVIILGFADIFFGKAEIQLSEMLAFISGGHIDTASKYIITQIRLPRVITAISAGAALSASGLLMQTLFRNPLAGPYVLGVSSGAGVGVALFLMGFSGSTLALSSSFLSMGMVLFAWLGGSLVFLIMILVSGYFRQNTSLLIVGIMLGSFAGAIINLLEYYSEPAMVQRFVIWTMGSLSGTDWRYLNLLIPILITGLVFAFFLSKPLDLFVLGEEQAFVSGINVKSLKVYLIVISSIITSTITAFVGPIAFVGIAVPYLARIMLKTISFRWLLPVTVTTGCNLMLLCDIISQLPGKTETLPINAITALFGAPVIVVLLLKNRQLNSTV